MKESTHLNYSTVCIYRMHYRLSQVYHVIAIDAGYMPNEKPNRSTVLSQPAKFTTSQRNAFRVTNGETIEDNETQTSWLNPSYRRTSWLNHPV